MAATTNGRPARLNLANARAPAPTLDGSIVEVDRSPPGPPGAWNGNDLQPTPDGDPVLEDLARLEALRQSVQANLKLRPIVNVPAPGPVFALSHRPRNDSISSISSMGSPASVYYTPVDHYTPNPLFSPAANSMMARTPESSSRPGFERVDEDDEDADQQEFDGGMHPRELFHSLQLTHRRPLMLDLRPLPNYLQARIEDSINLSIPSLILKRVRKPNGAFKSLDALRPFITTDQARDHWDSLLKPGTDLWDGVVILFDHEMDEHEQHAAVTSPAWTLYHVLSPIVPTASYLRGGFALVLALPDLEHHIARGEPPQPIPPSPPPAQLLAPPQTAGLGEPSHPLAPRIAFTASTPLPPPSARSFALRTDVAQAGTRMRTTIDHSLDSANGRTPSPLPLASPPRTPRTPSHLRIDIPPPPASPRPPALTQQKPARPTLSLAPTAPPSTPGHASLSIPIGPAPPARTTSLALPTAGPVPPLSTATPPQPAPLAATTSLPSNLPSGHASGPAPGPGGLQRPRLPSLKGLSLDTTSLRPHTLGMGASHSAHPGAPRVSERMGSAHPMLGGGGLSLGTNLPGPGGQPKLSLMTGSEQLSAMPITRRVVGSAMHPRGQYPGAPASLLGPAPRVASELFGAAPAPSRLGPSGLSMNTGGLTVPTSSALADDDDMPPPSGMEPAPGTFDWGAASRSLHGDYADSNSSSSLSSPPSPQPPTARPSSALSTPDSSEMPAQFIVSCILPGFLFLGPEITTDEQAAELESRGVKRILNIAAECDDDHGLNLRTRFDKYMHIPIRDTVEEENIAKGVQEVCKFLDDARLHSSATYVHCKAGKSRSVTAVMAYLIHANHWPLSKAYAFVLERRKGISPNIGFVSELMTFEERELGGKSGGVNGSASHGSAASAHNAYTSGGQSAHPSSTAGRRARPAHVRESLPPQTSDSTVPLYMQHAGVDEELEVKDASGRYRHQRRAPVDERTLQPTRRVSKAGLESSEWEWRERPGAPENDADEEGEVDAIAQALNALERAGGSSVPAAGDETGMPGRPW